MKPGVKKALAALPCMLMVLSFVCCQSKGSVEDAGAGAAPGRPRAAALAAAAPVLVVPAATPTAAPAPTPTTAPTPPPHPWERYFSDEPFVYCDSPDDGPWIYRDSTLSVRVEKRANDRKQVYFLAEIHTRGPLPFGGFANKNPKAGSRIKPYRIARQYQAVLGITGDYITYKENKKGVMIRNGRVFYKRKQADTLAVLPDGELRVYPAGKVTAEELEALGVKDSFAFGPVLVNGGKINEKLNRAHNHPKNYRTTVGMAEKGHYYFIVTEGRFLYEELAQIYVDLGCTVAYNLDGGNSAAMVFMGEQLNLHTYNPDLKLGQRPLPDLVMIGQSPQVPGEEDPVYNDGQKKYKKNRPGS